MRRRKCKQFVIRSGEFENDQYCFCYSNIQTFNILSEESLGIFIRCLLLIVPWWCVTQIWPQWCSSTMVFVRKFYLFAPMFDFSITFFHRLHQSNSSIVFNHSQRFQSLNRVLQSCSVPLVHVPFDQHVSSTWNLTSNNDFVCHQYKFVITQSQTAISFQLESEQLFSIVFHRMWNTAKNHLHRNLTSIWGRCAHSSLGFSFFSFIFMETRRAHDCGTQNAWWFMGSHQNTLKLPNTPLRLWHRLYNNYTHISNEKNQKKSTNNNEQQWWT